MLCPAGNISWKRIGDCLRGVLPLTEPQTLAGDRASWARPERPLCPRAWAWGAFHASSWGEAPRPLHQGPSSPTRC
ncbi:hypothetical protein BD626DRAFT_500886 [Schizophyllum amplum]|uniref:Uncharacterized protein n=1 Tax=Schizophyllum amplum TaxID=97359 RepID=A0A550CB37_9AGAR|nr:hypothetical protein BD626DRAFT_500886 [Auriculariopsis ampla]